MILQLTCNLLCLDMGLEMRIRLNSMSVDIVLNHKGTLLSYFSLSFFLDMSIKKIVIPNIHICYYNLNDLAKLNW